MGTIRDIIINLLANAIWAIGGYMVAQTPFFKKTFTV
jgi:hypothetical protein